MALQVTTAEDVAGAGCICPLSCVGDNVALSSGLMAVVQNPGVIPLAAMLCQHRRFGGTCRVGFYSQKEERGGLGGWLGFWWHLLWPVEEEGTDVFTGSKLVFLSWVGISQIQSTEAEDGVGLLPSREDLGVLKPTTRCPTPQLWGDSSQPTSCDLGGLLWGFAFPPRHTRSTSWAMGLDGRCDSSCHHEMSHGAWSMVCMSLGKAKQGPPAPIHT